MRGPLFYISVTLIIFSLLHLSCAPKSTSVDPSEIAIPVAIEGKENLFHAGRFYFGGQPDEEMLHWLAGENVKAVINLRTDSEMETHEKEKFDEDSLVTDLGMTYLHFPMGGKVGYSTQVVDTFAQTLDTLNVNTFIHCKVGGRVSYLWVAYLIRHKNVAIDDAIDIGKKMKFSFALEDLVGFPFSMRKKE